MDYPNTIHIITFHKWKKTPDSLLGNPNQSTINMTESSPTNLPGFQPLYYTTRNGIVESIHYGAIAVVTTEGKLFARVGDPQARTFLRSSAKPFQSIPLLEMGGREKFQLRGEELAVICASHSGTEEHLRTIVGVQRKIGITESDLLCGTHPPFDSASRNKLQDQGLSPTQNHHNCSGKHTGMLAQAALLGVSREKYTEIEHPVQQGILSVFSEMCGLDPNDIDVGRDGCSVPTFAIPLYNAAWAWAKLVNPESLPSQRKESCQQITTAMSSHPFYVAGPGRIDTRLMQTAPGKIITKAGAEAYQAIGVVKNAVEPGSQALGIALKIAGGDLGKRARRAVTLEVLHQLKVLTDPELQSLSDLGPVQTNYNQAGLTTGEAKPCFQLQYS
jgi:L-asparaginase II